MLDITNAEIQFKWAIRDAHQRGIYPSPTFLNILLHNRKSSNLNGRETRWRTEAMKELNIPLKRPRAIVPKIICCMNKPGCRCCA
jgi:hypothetical protein